MATKKKMLQAAAGQAGGAGLDITEVFSTYLYDGNGSTQTITNDIDLAGEGGLVWLKGRNNGNSHYLHDSERTITKWLQSQTAAAEQTNGPVTSFNSNGFSLGFGQGNGGANSSGDTFASWTFRKAPKFFDVVTYTGDGVAGREIAHDLGTTVGSIFVKRTDATRSWTIYHRSRGATKYLALNTTGAENTATSRWNDTEPTSTVFTVGSAIDTNVSGGTYVAYVFAHNNGDGEFGPDGDQDIIKCGSYTGNGSETNGTEVDLGFEPQWLLVKASSTTADWFLVDNMRGWGPPNTGQSSPLRPNASSAESSNSYNTVEITPTGFKLHSISDDWNGSGNTYIYMAIRRGPLAPPESGTEVFATDTKNSTGDNKTPLYRSGFPIDLALLLDTDGGVDFPQVHPRLTSTAYLRTNNSAAEQSGTAFTHDFMNGFRTDTSFNADTTRVCHMWKRAPGFFDVVAYTGTGSARTVSHNLGVAPEMIWVKSRNVSGSWRVYHKDIGNTGGITINLSNAAFTLSTLWNDTSPTSTDFTLGTYGEVNTNGNTHIAYLFATVPGVSKVGSVSHTNGTDTNVDCGFSSGARFILLKRTDGASSWYVWDTARGIVAGDDKVLYLQSTLSEQVGDSVDPLSSGFTMVGGSFDTGSYIFYAIA